MSIKHRNQILDTLGGLLTDIKQPIEKVLTNLSNIVCDFNHERLMNALEKRKVKESTPEKPSEVIIDIKEIKE
jgi:hypothetical protein